MGWKVLVWICFGGLFYYRHSAVAQYILLRASEFGQYLAALACFGVKTIAVFARQAAAVLNHISPHVIVYLKIFFQAFRWLCQQVLLGLLGFKSGWVVFLSWTLVFCVLYLFIAHKTRNWWSVRSRTERGPNVVNMDTIRNLAANRDQRNGSAVAVSSQGFARRRPIRNLAGGDNIMPRDVQAQNQESGVLGGNDRRGGASQEGDHAVDDIVLLTQRIEANLDARNCVVCFENEKNTAVFPCGHAQMCRHCAHEVQRSSNRCPICQHCIVEIRTVFI